MQVTVEKALKDMKRYKIRIEDSGLRNRMKSTLMEVVTGSYKNYLKTVNPHNAYSVEDIEAMVDKMIDTS